MAVKNVFAKGKGHERLEFEDEDERQSRIQNALERLDSPSKITNCAPLPFDFGDRTTHPVKPSVELLSRVQAFLPQLEASNALLAQQVDADPRNVDIEHIPEDQDQYIEMNLGLGVFEDRKGSQPDNGFDAASASTSGSSDVSDEDSSDDDSDDSLDSENGDIVVLPSPSRPIRPLPRRTTKMSEAPNSTPFVTLH